MTTWTAPDATDVDLAAIEACREPRWMTAAETRESAEPGGHCKASSAKRRAYPSKKPPTLKGL